MNTTVTDVLTMRSSFSFYVPSSEAHLIEPCAGVADATVIKGTDGPRMIQAMRSRGWSGSVLFDRAGYDPRTPAVEAERWLETQAAAGADRLLSPGRWIPWDESGDELKSGLDREHESVASATGTTLTLALDSRWLTKGLYSTLEALGGLDAPVALVLAHTGDPLSATVEVVNNLLALTRNVTDLTLLRSDHGAIGAVAFGAIHGSIGLRPTYRHFTPPRTQAWAIPGDKTPRVFVWDLMDWFTAHNVAGWTTAHVNLDCKLKCCGGQRIDRFLDERRAAEATQHNITVLAHLARFILDAPETDRRRLFGKLCAEAVGRYGTMGKISMRIEPKRQLLQWAQFA